MLLGMGIFGNDSWDNEYQNIIKSGNKAPYSWHQEVYPIFQTFNHLLDEEEVRNNVIRAVAKADSCYQYRYFIGKEDIEEYRGTTIVGMTEKDERYILQEGQALVYRKKQYIPFPFSLFFSNSLKPAAWIQLTEEGKLVIGFRQTLNITDWGINCKVKPTSLSDKKGRAHLGFYDLSKDLFKQIDEIIPILRPHDISDDAPLEIHMGGFSQGAAMAKLIGYFLKKKYPYLKIKLVLIGAPTFLDEEGAEEIDQYFNVNNINFYALTTPFGKDIVHSGIKKIPFYPFKHRSSGHLHQRKLYWFSSKKAIMPNPYSVHNFSSYYSQLTSRNFFQKWSRSFVRR